jgi:protein-S-isoprenylcysteine O-methyltransferase Ste14
MFSGVYQSAVILAVVAAFYTMDVWLMHRYDRARAEGSGRSWGWTLFAVFLAAVLVIQPAALPGLGLHTTAVWGLVAQAIGLGLVVAGLALHGWARVHLRQFYSERMELQQGQYLVKSGPYAYVRHPIYTSFFMCTVGLLLVNPAVTMLLVAVYFFWDFPRTARKEEALLGENLAGYRDYVARTPRYLPRLGWMRRPGRRTLFGAGSDRA